MNKIYIFNEDEMERIIKMISKIDSTIKEMSNRGFPKEYKDFCIENLSKIDECNFSIGQIIDMYE